MRIISTMPNRLSPNNLTRTPNLNLIHCSDKNNHSKVPTCSGEPLLPPHAKPPSDALSYVAYSAGFPTKASSVAYSTQSQHSPITSSPQSPIVVFDHDNSVISIVIIGRERVVFDAVAEYEPDRTAEVLVAGFHAPSTHMVLGIGCGQDARLRNMSLEKSKAVRWACHSLIQASSRIHHSNSDGCRTGYY